MDGKYEKATFGAGCFWGVEKVFGEIEGVKETAVGYTGGAKKNPTYEEVCTGRTGHAEAVEVVYDPAKVKYSDLLAVFWTHHDPTTLNRQGNDAGTQYRSAIFVHDEAQKKEAERELSLLEKSGVYGGPITTKIEPASDFWRAEDYHQKYLKKNPRGYCHILLQSKEVARVLRENPAEVKKA